MKAQTNADDKTRIEPPRTPRENNNGTTIELKTDKLG
jgi:hypothetical protein